MNGQIRVLHRLFLKRVLRSGISSGLPPTASPQAIPIALLGDALFFGLCGITALYFLQRSIDELELYLQGATLALVGVFLLNAAADVLANPDEMRVLSSRPVSLRAVLGAKTLVLAQIGLWFAGAFNLAGMAIAPFVSGGSWRFIPIHLLSLGINVVFALGCVLLLHRYRIFRSMHGRWVAILPWLIPISYAFALAWTLDFNLMDLTAKLSPGGRSALLFPPAWFAGIDALASDGGSAAWSVAAIGTVTSGATLALGFRGLGGENKDWTAAFAAPSNSPPRTTSRLLDGLLRLRPLTWGLRTSAARAAFSVTILYLARSRDLRFRLLSALVPVLAMPLLLWFPGLRAGTAATFWTLVIGIYLAVFAFLAVQFIETSSDWRAARIFYRGPLQGPAELSKGAGRAVIVFAMPASLLYFAAVIWATRGIPALALLVPGIIAVPLFASLPSFLGRGVPLVAAPSAGTSQTPLQVMARFAWYSVPAAAIFTTVAGTRMFWILVGVETVLIAGYLRAKRRHVAALSWAVVNPTLP